MKTNRCIAWMCCAGFTVAASLSHAQTPDPVLRPGAPPPASAPPPAPSSTARRLYDAQKDKLLQIRLLVSGAQSQASAGSGFIVTPDGLVITNYHVISQLVWEPERYRGEFVRTDQTKGEITLVAIDVQHDLAVVKLSGAKPAGALPVMTLAPDDSLQQGDRVFSMGNPLDLGFAISEGTFNGRPERSLYPQLLFTGAMNPGVSGGPAIDESGRVVGVNVAGYGRAAELTNFQVPVKFVKALLAQAQTRPQPALGQIRADLRTQMLAHQNVMLDALHKGQWTTESLGAYNIPVIPSTLARCWGEASDSSKKFYRFETARCDLGGSLYLQGNLRAGSVATQHESLTSPSLSALTFAHLRSKSFSNESHHDARHNRHRTASRCTEDFINNGALSMRSVVCVRAYRKIEGLYDIATVAVTLDQDKSGLESVLTLNGVDYARGMEESKRFLGAISRRSGASKRARPDCRSCL